MAAAVALRLASIAIGVVAVLLATYWIYAVAVPFVWVLVAVMHDSDTARDAVVPDAAWAIVPLFFAPCLGVGA